MIKGQHYFTVIQNARWDRKFWITETFKNCGFLKAGRNHNVLNKLWWLIWKGIFPYPIICHSFEDVRVFGFPHLNQLCSIVGTIGGNGNGNGAPCSFVNKRQINCNSSVYTDKIAWRTSRAYVNEQIRQLRAQLGELKEIRSHLKAKRPNVYIEYPADIDMADLDGDLLQIEGDLIKPNNQQQPEKPAHTRHCNCKSKRYVLWNLNLPQLTPRWKRWKYIFRL